MGTKHELCLLYAGPRHRRHIARRRTHAQLAHSALSAPLYAHQQTRAWRQVSRRPASRSHCEFNF